MNYREAEIFAPAYLGTAGTEPIQIKLADCISCIELIWDTTVVTVSDMLLPHAACISKVELVDGSEVLTALSGEEIQALAYHTKHGMPLDEISVVAGDHMRSVLPIYFGRKLYDPLLAFDPKKFRNPQLMVTWDQDAANTGVVVNSLTVRADVFDEKVPSPQGFLMTKEIKSYTPENDTPEYTNMPLDYPWRLLMIQSESTDKNPFEVMSQVRLAEERDKKVPLDMTGEEIFRKICQKLGPISQNVRLNETVADAMALHLTPTYGQVCQVAYDDAALAATAQLAEASFAGCIASLAATVDVAPMRALVQGYAPHFCFAVPFGDLDDIDDWYDVTKLGNLTLTTLGAAAVGTTPAARIVLQQLRKY